MKLKNYLMINLLNKNWWWRNNFLQIREEK